MANTTQERARLGLGLVMLLPGKEAAMPSTGVPITQVSMLAAGCDVHMARCLYCSWGVAPSPEGLFWRCVCVTL